jgi:hypothetical protein
VRGEEVLSADLEGLVRTSPTTPSPRDGTTTTLNDLVEDNRSITEPIRSPMSAPSDLDSFSVVSDIDVEGSQVLQLTNLFEVVTSADLPDPPTDPADRLTSLVHRYHDLCHTIGTLRDSISKQAEGMKAKAREDFERAKLRVETSRGQARETVESMRKATDSTVYIRLPWTLAEDGLVLLVRGHSSRFSDKAQIAQ